MLERLVAFDHHLSTRLSALPSSTARALVRMVAHTGDGWPWLILGALATLTTHEPLRHVALWALITIVVSGTFVGGIKLFIHRKRPPGQRDQLYFSFDHHSFPSGHAARVAALAIVLGSLHSEVAFPLALWALVVALSRVVLGVHYLFDVLAGLAVGVIVGDILRRL